MLTTQDSIYLNWISQDPGKLVPGSTEHRDAFCRMLLDTYNPYRPAVIDWPALSETEMERIAGLPFWDTAVAIEGRASLRMDWQADNIEDPLIREALKLNAAEERRHKDVLHHMITFYGIRLGPEPTYRRPSYPELGFLRTGYGECINSFFAFGLFELAKRSGFFPLPLVETFEPVIQEEARHILFFANYLAYRRARLKGLRYLAFQATCVVAILEQLMSRLDMAIAARRNRKRKRKGIQTSFLAGGAKSLTTAFDKRAFLRLCLGENDRRMAGYDMRLQRPRLVPWLVSLFAGSGQGAYR
ncbi:MAG: ferritin-like domain-containing protein [Dongiaceae bacterium]